MVLKISKIIANAIKYTHVISAINQLIIKYVTIKQNESSHPFLSAELDS